MKFLPTNFKTTCNAHLGKYSLAKGEQLRNNSVVFIPMREEEKVFIFQFLVIIQLYKVDNVAVFTDSNIFLRVCELFSIYKKKHFKEAFQICWRKEEEMFCSRKAMYSLTTGIFFFFRLSKQQSFKKGEKEKGEKCIWSMSSHFWLQMIVHQSQHTLVRVQ